MERIVLAVGKSLFRPHHLFAGWWFQTFFIVHHIWALYGNNHPNWLIFFRGVETTNQSSFVWGFMLHGVPRFVTWHTRLTGHRGAFCRARLYQQKLGSSRGGSNAGGEEFWVTEKQLNESYDHLPKINISYLYDLMYIYIYLYYMIYIYIYVCVCHVCEMQVGTACICMYTNRHTESHRVTFKACTTCPTASATWVKRRSDGRAFVRSQGPGRLSLAGDFRGRRTEQSWMVYFMEKPI